MVSTMAMLMDSEDRGVRAVWRKESSPAGLNQVNRATVVHAILRQDMSDAVVMREYKASQIKIGSVPIRDPSAALGINSNFCVPRLCPASAGLAI